MEVSPPEAPFLCLTAPPLPPGPELRQDLSFTFGQKDVFLLYYLLGLPAPTLVALAAGPGMSEMSDNGKNCSNNYYSTLITAQCSYHQHRILHFRFISTTVT